MSSHREVLSWDSYFMAMAHLAAFRSKDPNTQVGACIVNAQNRVVGMGYNGFPRGCPDEEYSWKREGEYLDTKYPYVVHAELNAILNSIMIPAGCRIYVSLFPCNECAKAIIQSGIREVIYESDKYDGTPDNIASKRMFASAGVKLRRLPDIVKIQVDVIHEDHDHDRHNEDRKDEAERDGGCRCCH